MWTRLGELALVRRAEETDCTDTATDTATPRQRIDVYRVLDPTGVVVYCLLNQEVCQKRPASRAPRSSLCFGSAGGKRQCGLERQTDRYIQIFPLPPRLCPPDTMPLSSLLRITSSSPRVLPAAVRSSQRAASTLSNAKSLDSILIANRGEIALYT